jgi:DNA replication protein DnaC
MLTAPLIERLTTLRLRGMAASLEQQLASPDVHRLPFEDRLTLMIEQELLERGNARLAQRLRWAKLPVQACVEDLDTRSARGIDRGQLAQLADLGWIREHLNVLVTGPTGVGKSFVASALAHAACRADFNRALLPPTAPRRGNRPLRRDAKTLCTLSPDRQGRSLRHR